MAVEFNEPTYGVSSAPLSKRGVLIALVMKLGLAKDDKQAQTALIVILVLVVTLTIGVLFLGDINSSATPEAQVLPEELIVQ